MYLLRLLLCLRGRISFATVADAAVFGAYAQLKIAQNEEAVTTGKLLQEWCCRVHDLAGYLQTFWPKASLESDLTR